MRPSIFILLLIALNSSPLLAEQFKVAVLVPLSGDIADFGAAVRNGTEMASREQNQALRDKVKFIFEDSKYDSKTTILAFNKVVNIDNVDVAYSWGTTPSVALAPVADNKKVPLFAMSGDPSVAGNRKYVIDFSNRLADISKKTLNYLRKKGYKRFAIVKSEFQYTEALVEGMQEHLASDESITILGSYAPGTNPNFNSVVAKLKANRKEFDALGVMLGTGHLSSFYRKMANYHISLPTFGSDFLGQQEELNKAGKSVVGAVFVTPYVSKSFSKRYKKEYNSELHLPYAANAYSFAKLIYKLIAQSSAKPSGAEVLKSIELMDEISGAGGKLVFENEDPSTFKLPGKRFKFPLKIVKISNDLKAEYFLDNN